MDGEPGPVERSVDALLGSLHYEESDPRSAIGLVALQLAAALDRSPGAVMLSRELRASISWLIEQPNVAPGAVDEVRARRAARRVIGLLDAAG